MRKPAVNVALAVIALASCSVDTAPSNDALRAGGFSGLGIATDVAHAKGFFAEQNIDFKYERVDSSEELMTKLIGGEYDIIQTNADNVIAWTEGQGIDGQPHDFVIVMGGYRGRQPLEFIVAPDITSVADLRGKELAVDAINTGYSTILIYILQQEGLLLDEDYTLKPVGGGPKRIESLLAGDTVGGFVVFSDELRERGFYRLFSSADYITDYARGVTTTRRDWAEDNEELLVRYIRAMTGAINWLLEPANRDEAIALIATANDVSAEEAEALYAKAVNPVFGFLPGARIEPAGIEQIIRIREVTGQMQSPLPSADKYIESRYYERAIATNAP